MSLEKSPVLGRPPFPPPLADYRQGEEDRAILTVSLCVCMYDANRSGRNSPAGSPPVVYGEKMLGNGAYLPNNTAAPMASPFTCHLWTISCSHWEARPRTPLKVDSVTTKRYDTHLAALYKTARVIGRYAECLHSGFHWS